MVEYVSCWMYISKVKEFTSYCNNIGVQTEVTEKFVAARTKRQVIAAFDMNRKLEGERAVFVGMEYARLNAIADLGG